MATFLFFLLIIATIIAAMGHEGIAEVLGVLA